MSKLNIYTIDELEETLEALQQLHEHYEVEDYSLMGDPGTCPLCEFFLYEGDCGICPWVIMTERTCDQYTSDKYNLVYIYSILHSTRKNEFREHRMEMLEEWIQEFQNEIDTRHLKEAV